MIQCFTITIYECYLLIISCQRTISIDDASTCKCSNLYQIQKCFFQCNFSNSTLTTIIYDSSTTHLQLLYTAIVVKKKIVYKLESVI